MFSLLPPTSPTSSIEAAPMGSPTAPAGSRMFFFFFLRLEEEGGGGAPAGRAHPMQKTIMQYNVGSMRTRAHPTPQPLLDNIQHGTSRCVIMSQSQSQNRTRLHRGGSPLAGLDSGARAGGRRCRSCRCPPRLLQPRRRP